MQKCYAEGKHWRQHRDPKRGVLHLFHLSKEVSLNFNSPA